MQTKHVIPAVGSGEKERFLVDGKEVSQEEYLSAQASESRLAELLGSHEVPGGHLPSCWPMTGSNACMVHPNQLKQQQEYAAAQGVPTDFDHHCRPIFRDRQHRKEYMGKVERMVDRQGGYGDRTGT